MEIIKKLLLTSSPYLSQNITNLLASFFGNNTGLCKAAVIPTAARKLKEKQNGAKAIYERLNECAFRAVDFVDIEFENPKKLIGYDLIFLTGGDPNYLLMHLKKSGADNVLKDLYSNGIFMAGSSAGAMVYGKDIRIAQYFDKTHQPYIDEDFSGLSCLPSIVLPHITSLRTEFLNFEKLVSECENQVGFPVLFIEDDQAIFILNDVPQSFLFDPGQRQ